MRVLFVKGKQRDFLKKVLLESNVSSLRSLMQFGFDVPYSTLKNYFNEDRTLPLEFFEQLCELARLDKKDFDFELVEDSWGQSKGGKKSKRK